jgi:starvation-inducible DNA-binding protein
MPRLLGKIMLVDLLKQLLATQYSFSLKAAGYHWNVGGVEFLQSHEYLGELYSSLYDPVDKIAEYVRILDQYAPAGLSRYLELSLVGDAEGVATQPQAIYASLQTDLNVLVELLNQVFDMATLERQQAIANFAADQLDQRTKDQWKLKQLLKSSS